LDEPVALHEIGQDIMSYDTHGVNMWFDCGHFQLHNRF